MEAVFFRVLDMSITACWVIAAILLIRLLLKRAPKKYSYALWAVAAFRLICPVSIESAFSIFNLGRLGSKPAGARIPDPGAALPLPQTPAAPVTSAPPTVISPDILPTATPDISFVTPTAAPVVPPEPESALTLMGILSVIWCAGIVLLLAYSVISCIRLRRSMATSVLLEGNIRQAEDIPSPFILGFIRPQIYIPYHLSEGELGYVLAHERYHLRRGDHIVKPLAFLILVLHWFNPVVWLAFYLMVRDMEMSCDEKVLSENEGIRKAYSSTLLSFAAGRAFPAPSPLSFGEGNVKSRIKNVLHWKKPALWISIAAIIICIAVILAFATNPRESIALEDVDSVYAKGSAVSDNAAEELVTLLNSHRKSTYGSAPDSVGITDSRVIINMADGSSYAVHHWYCSGFSFNPLHLGEDDYYTILSRLDAEGKVEKSWKMEYDFDAQFLSWLEVHSLSNSYPFGSSFTLSEIIFKKDNGVTLPIETAEIIRLESDMKLYAGDELPGTFEQWTITESGWDNYLTGSSGTWTAYNAAEMRRNNFRAWRSVNGDRMYCLLLQEDGTLYLAGGYYDAEGEYDSESDDSNIFCIYELTDKDSVRWHYIPYEHPDYFPLDFDFEYSSIHFLCTRGVVRYLDANGFINFNTDITLSEHDSELGWWPTGAMDMSVVNKSEMIFGRNDPPGEIYFTAELKNGETLSGTIVFSNPKEKDPDLYEAALIADGLCIKSAPEGEGAVIYREESDFGGVYAPVACVYIAPHSSYYPWGGDSGYRYIIGSESITVKSMDGSSSEVIPFDNWNYSVLDPHSDEWTEKFIGDAPTFENIKKPLYLQVSEEYFILNLDGQLCIGEISGGLVWDIYAIVPETQLGSAVWEYRPELSSRSPWFEFEFDMEYKDLQISTSVGDLFSDGSRVNGKQLGLPMGSTVRWSPLGRFQQSSYTQLQFTINFADGGMLQGTIYISSEDNTLYTAALHANGLRLSNDEDYGHAVISLADSSAVIGGTDHAAIIADKLNETINMGGSYYLTPYIADYGKQETLLINHRNDISGFIRRCRLTPVEMPSTEPSEYWLEISGIIPGTTITVWQGSSDTVQLTTEEGSQYYRVDSGDLAASLMEFYSNNAPYTPEFTSDLDELLSKWQAEGVTELSAENLLLLNRNFVATITGEGNPLSNFFTCYYDRPEELNLAAFLQYNFISSAAYTEEDFYALKQQYPYHGQLDGSDTYEDAVKYGNPIHKYPREKVDEQLMRYMGITTADITAEIDWENSGLVYLAEADAYFNFTSDMAAGAFDADSGEIVGDTAYLYSGFATLTLKKWGDVWLIVSHTYAEDAATTAYLANSVIEIFDIGGEMDITLHTSDIGAHETITVTDRSVAEQISYILEEHQYTELEAPLTEPSEYRISIEPTMPVNKLTVYSGNTQMLQYSPRGRHSYYNVSTEGVGSLVWAVRRVYENLLLDHERIEGFAADSAEAAAELFTETVYGEHLMSLPAGGVYSIEDYNAVAHEIIEISEDGSSVRGKFTFAVWPEDHQKSGWWTDGIMGTADIGAEYYGRILCTREYLLGFGKDGLWHCNALDPVE